MWLSKELMSNVFKEKFANHPFIKKVAFYQNLVFLEVKTDTIFFALDFWENGTIELVFRDEVTPSRFTTYFSYPFAKRAILFKEGQCVHSLLMDIDIYYQQINETMIAELAKRIIDKFLQVGKDVALQSEISNSLLKGLHDQISLQVTNDIFIDMANFFHGKLLSIKETVQLIHDKELSISRYGDGEIMVMLSKNGPGFQKHDWKLMRELREINLSNNDLLVCYAGLVPEEIWWDRFWTKYWAKCKFFLQREIYGDALITRPEAFHLYGQEIVNLWKRIWQNKNVCFVTGEGSLMNTNHIMFNNINSTKFIYTQPRNCYECIDEIFNQCKQQMNVDMFLIALGPTGTILANRLYQAGYRALDIGHLNNSYDTVFKNFPMPEAIHQQMKQNQK